MILLYCQLISELEVEHAVRDALQEMTEPKLKPAEDLKPLEVSAAAVSG